MKRNHIFPFLLLCLSLGAVTMPLQAEETLTLPCACQFYVPNAFSPNQDGYNDVFLPNVSSVCGIQSYQIRIFNRWGGLVFESNNIQQGWDGKVKGSPAPQGAYFYTIQYAEPGDGTPEVLTLAGELALLR